MTEKPEKRRRRTAEEAREEIIDAAERILVELGTDQLKFQVIAEQTGISQSTIHHHFGGVNGIKAALVQRLLQDLVVGMGKVITDTMQEPLETRIQNAIRASHDLLMAEKYICLIGWLAATWRESAGDSQVGVSAVRYLEEISIAALGDSMPADKARRIVPIIIHQTVVSAIGQGMLRGFFETDGLESYLKVDGTEMLIEQILRLSKRGNNTNYLAFRDHSSQRFVAMM